MSFIIQILAGCTRNRQLKISWHLERSHRKSGFLSFSIPLFDRHRVRIDVSTRRWVGRIQAQDGGCPFAWLWKACAASRPIRILVPSRRWEDCRHWGCCCHGFLRQPVQLREEGADVRRCCCCHLLDHPGWEEGGGSRGCGLIQPLPDNLSPAPFCR